MLTDLQLGYFWSKFSFSATDAPICGFNKPNKISLRGDDFLMSYFYNSSVNSRVIGLRTWYGRAKDPKNRRKIDGSFLTFILFLNIITFEVLGDAHMVL